MSELASSATAAGTRENILVVANNSNSQALLAAAAAAVAISPITGSTAGAGGQTGNNTSSSNASNSLQQVRQQQSNKGSNPNANRLTPNSAMYSLPPMSISQSSSRSSLCTPRSSTSLLSTTDIDNLLLDMHGLNHAHHHHHLLNHQQQSQAYPNSNQSHAHQNAGHLNFGQMQSSGHHLPVIGSANSFLTSDSHRHSVHLGTASSVHPVPSNLNSLEAHSLLDSSGKSLGAHLQLSSTAPNFSNGRLFLDVANGGNTTKSSMSKSMSSSSSVVKMRNKAVGGGKNGPPSAAQHNKLMAFLNSDSALSSMLPSASSSSSLMTGGGGGSSAKSAYLSQAAMLQANTAAHQHLQHSYSSSNVQPHQQSMMTASLHSSNQPNYNSIGMPSSASSISSNSSSQFCPQPNQPNQHFLSSLANNASVPLLLSDYDEYGTNGASKVASSSRNSALSVAGSGQGVNAAVASALINQYRQSTHASSAPLNSAKMYGTLGSSTDARNEFESLYRK